MSGRFELLIDEVGAFGLFRPHDATRRARRRLPGVGGAEASEAIVRRGRAARPEEPHGLAPAQYAPDRMVIVMVVVAQENLHA